MIPDPKAVIPGPTLLQTFDPWSHILCYYPEKSRQMFLLVSAATSLPLKGTPTWRFQTFTIPNTSQMKYRTDLILGVAFHGIVYLLSFPRCLTFCIEQFAFLVWWRDSENRNAVKLGWPKTSKTKTIELTHIFRGCLENCYTGMLYEFSLKRWHKKT